ncbi:MAG: hypothetical protein HY736_16690 [Verrucomicrobia bacterium]|nr:hypothetical protein [Verrucomicrobiota bacterium]
MNTDGVTGLVAGDAAGFTADVNCPPIALAMVFRFDCVSAGCQLAGAVWREQSRSLRTSRLTVAERKTAAPIRPAQYSPRPTGASVEDESISPAGKEFLVVWCPAGISTRRMVARCTSILTQVALCTVLSAAVSHYGQSVRPPIPAAKGDSPTRLLTPQEELKSFVLAPGSSSLIRRISGFFAIAMATRFPTRERRLPWTTPNVRIAQSV